MYLKFVEIVLFNIWFSKKSYESMLSRKKLNLNVNVNEPVIFYLMIIFQNKLNVVMDDGSDNISFSMIKSEEEEEQQESHQTTISIQPTTTPHPVYFYH